MKQINDSFKAMANGNLDFLKRYPMSVDPQKFAWVNGDKETMNPMTGFKSRHYTPVTETQAIKGQNSKGFGVNKDRNVFIGHKSAPVYVDWSYEKPRLAGAQAINKMRVEPELHLINFGGHSAKMYYLPWGADQMHTMTIGDEADFFVTATMHGCRFSAKDHGDGYMTVSHANVQPGEGVDAQGEVLKMIQQQESSSGMFAPTALSFGKDKYFADANRLIDRTKQGLMPIGVMPEDVRSAHVDTYLANVVGVRSGRQWRFYYQLTCIADVVIRGKTSVPKYFGRFGRKVVDSQIDAKLDLVLKVAEIWPREQTVYQM